MKLPTPDEWNAAHPEPVEYREMAPVACPVCGTQMYYPDQDALSPKRVVRCGSKRQYTLSREQSVADLMREWRRVAGLSTADAGERIGRSARSIEDIEQGRRRSRDYLTAVALKKMIDDLK